MTSGSAFAADTFAAEFARLARERDVGFIAVLWVAAVARAVILLYGVVNLIPTVLMKTGVSAVPDSLGAKALSWHLWLWNSYWTLGGVLFLIAARAGSRRPGSRPRR